MKLVLYGKRNCGLCEEAKFILNQLKYAYKFEYEEIDIYEDESLIERYGMMIPVIEMNGEIVEYGEIHKCVISKRLTKELRVE
ncbi:glutaredoxin family protein [Ectobacillus polymachus]|uniref:glutaredoxin family protein n=1 Tax=Ectobacillus polymachus TaxID=1508806 RepID=UPI003A89673A